MQVYILSAGRLPLAAFTKSLEQCQNELTLQLNSFSCVQFSGLCLYYLQSCLRPKVLSQVMSKSVIEPRPTARQKNARPAGTIIMRNESCSQTMVDMQAYTLSAGTLPSYLLARTTISQSFFTYNWQQWHVFFYPSQNLASHQQDRDTTERALTSVRSKERNYTHVLITLNYVLPTCYDQDAYLFHIVPCTVVRATAT